MESLHEDSRICVFIFILLVDFVRSFEKALAKGATDPRFRPRDHWDGRKRILQTENTKF